jgi:hypothetical protein
MPKLTYTTNHPASHYGQPVAVDRHGNALGPLDIAIQNLTKDVEGWRVVDEYDGLCVRATGNGFAQCFAEPTPAQERQAWYRYLRTNKLTVHKRHPRDFHNEFDLVIMPWTGKQSAADSRKEAELLANPYGGHDWYGTIRHEHAEEEAR